jgi:hypothetical protein
VVGRDHEEDRPGIGLDGELGRRGDGSGRVASLRLQNDGRVDAARARLLGDDEAELGVGDDHRRREQAFAGHAIEHLLEGRGGADQRHELLRHLLARHRPQAGACAAAQNDRDNKLIRHAVNSKGISRPRHEGPGSSVRLK